MVGEAKGSMIAVKDSPTDPTLRELMAYLLRPRRPKLQVRLRPYCPAHDVLMVGRKSLSGMTTFYCPCAGCKESWKGRKRVI